MQEATRPKSLTIPVEVANCTEPSRRSGELHELQPARVNAVEVVEHWQDLESERAAWDELADNALEPNHFFSASAVLAAMRHLRPAGKPAFLVLRATCAASPSAAPIWRGFFPFFWHRSYRGVWTHNLQLLKHDYCFLRVPLVRADCAAEVLGLVFDWLEASGAAIVELGDQTGTGAYAEALSALLRQRRSGAWLSKSHTRALFVPMDSAETYFSRSVSSGKLKELRRQARRLGEKGELRFEGLPPHGTVGDVSDIEAAIGEFLELEQAGWKGPNGTAMSCRPADREFFAEVARAAWRSDRLRILALRLGGRPIAMKCNFLAPPGAFAFKIAYAEEFSQYSPGVLLEIENIRRLHAETVVEWMDSCAAPEHPMIGHLWKERRLIQSWVVPLGMWGRFASASMRVLYWLRRMLVAARKRKPRWVVP